jgi:hypothetical protein
MAQSWDSKRLQHERAMYDRLGAELVTLAANITRLLLLAATTTNETGQRIIPNRARAKEQLSARIWKEALRPYFIGPGDDPLKGTEPQSPFMRLVVDGISGATAIQVDQQIALINRKASPTVKAWLTGPRPVEMATRRAVHELTDPRKPWYDPFHRWVDPNGHTLSERGWNTANEVRQSIDAFCQYHISQGTAAVDMARDLEAFLWPDAGAVRTQTPYGQDGSYWARRLARTEITAAAGRSTVNAALANPFVSGLKWNLSLSHPEPDICDTNAHGGEEGDGTYAKNELPTYPGHPFCLCFVTQQVTKSPAEVSRILEEWIAADAPEARALRGAFNRDWLLSALLNGDFIQSILDNDLVNLGRLLALSLGLGA